jgi:hypothetical protein
LPWYFLILYTRIRGILAPGAHPGLQPGFNYDNIVLATALALRFTGAGLCRAAKEKVADEERDVGDIRGYDGNA